jgi:hypothetical protein
VDVWSHDDTFAQRNQAQAEPLSLLKKEVRVMVGKLEETLAATRRRQHQQQRQQQQAHQPAPRHGPDLPEKQHQTKHNPVSERPGDRFSDCNQ